MICDLVERKVVNKRTYVFIDLSNYLSYFREAVVPKEYRKKWNWREPDFGRAFGELILKTFSEIPIDYQSSNSLYDAISLVVKPFRIYIYGSYTGEETRSFRSMINKLKLSGDVISYLILRGKKRREKTVDVRLAVDMLTYAIQNRYSIAILVSGDSDFIPVIERVMELGKKVYISHFYGYANHEIIETADRYLPIDFIYPCPHPFGDNTKTRISLTSLEEFISAYLKYLPKYNAYFVEALKENINKICTFINFSHNICEIIKYLPNDYNSLKKKLNIIIPSLKEFLEGLGFRTIDDLISEDLARSADKYTKVVGSIQRLLSRLLLQYNILDKIKFNDKST